MKKKTVLILVLALLFFSLLINYSQGQEEENGILTFIDGNAYLEMSLEWKVFYVYGLMDMLLFRTFLCDPELYFDIEKAVKDMKIQQTKAIFDKYLEEHPEEWHNSAASNFYSAIMEIVGEN